MIKEVWYNRRAFKATLKNIQLSKNQKYLVWNFELANQQKVNGFTTKVMQFGNRTYLWYSLLLGYFLPPSYTANMDEIIEKQCYIILNDNNVVTSIIPISNKKQIKQFEEVDQSKQSKPKNSIDKEYSINEELFK